MACRKENGKGMVEPPVAPAVRDAPIETRAQDRLSRARFANAIAQHIAEGNVSDGAVVAVMGPWGNGKTSVLNMICETLAERADDIEVFDFNPWYFSGTEQLVEHFFADLAARFSERKDAQFSDAAAALKRYGQLVRPVGHASKVLAYLGVPWAQVLADLAAKGGETLKDAGEAADALARKQSLKTLRADVKQAFTKLGKRIVIVLDDLDRLRADEIRDIVRLVRLVADLPNTVYVLAFDRRRVEQALAEGLGPDQKEIGRSYLEKIVEVSFDLPAIRPDDLLRILFTGLDSLLVGIDCGPFNKRDWTNYLGLGLREMFATPRDVRRYLNALPVILRVIGDDVALADVLALEAVRVLVPDYFMALPNAIDMLTGTKLGDNQKEQQQLREEYEALLALAAPHRAAVAGLNRYLFPTTERFERNIGGWDRSMWKRQGRVAHPDILRIYLEATLPTGVLPARVVAGIVKKLADEAALATALDALSPEEFENALERLREHEDEYPPGCTRVAVKVFFDRVSRVRRLSAHSFDMPPMWRLEFVGQSLLTRIENLDERMTVVRDVFGRLTSLSAKWALLMMVGYKSDRPQAIYVPKDDIEPLAEELKKQVITSTAARLAGEPELSTLLGWIAEEGELPRAAELLADDQFVLSLLHGDLHQGHWFAMGEVAQNAIRSLPGWDVFASVFGAERWTTRVREVKERAAKEALNAETKQLLELVNRYLGGWRPKRGEPDG
jgi:predicted KAP-like P-loop ATPase